MPKIYIRRHKGGCPLTLQQWRRLDIIEAVDGVPVLESIDRARQLKVVGRRTSVWVTEYLKKWKVGFDTRPVDGATLLPGVKRLVELAWIRHTQ